MGEVLGIDLGTTNTVVAATRDGKVSAVADQAGEIQLRGDQQDVGILQRGGADAGDLLVGKQVSRLVRRRAVYRARS